MQVKTLTRKVSVPADRLRCRTSWASCPAAIVAPSPGTTAVTWKSITRFQRSLPNHQPRLHPEQLIYIVEDADDQVLFFDSTFLPAVAALKPKLKSGFPDGRAR